MADELLHFKFLNPRPESGLDWLIFEFARQLKEVEHLARGDERPHVLQQLFPQPRLPRAGCKV